MAYLVKLVLYLNGPSRLKETVKDAIRAAGGQPQRSDFTQISEEAVEMVVSFLVKETQGLPTIVKAVEGVSGAAVMAVTEPQEVGNLKRV